MFDFAQLGDWDSSLVVWMLRCREYCETHALAFPADVLPEGVRRLMSLALAVPSETHGRTPAISLALFFVRAMAAEVDEYSSGIARVSRRSGDRARPPRARQREYAHDRFPLFRAAIGPAALGIVALISVLVGMILAYLGSVQLAQFGAQIYVAESGGASAWCARWAL